MPYGGKGYGPGKMPKKMQADLMRGFKRVPIPGGANAGKGQAVRKVPKVGLRPPM